jgi:hypothetical protein
MTVYDYNVRFCHGEFPLGRRALGRIAAGVACALLSVNKIIEMSIITV